MITIAPLLHEAESHLLRHDLDRAAALYAEAAALDATSPLPRVGVARVALATGKYAEALRMLDVLVTAYPNCAEAHTMRGVALEASGDLAAASGQLRHALTLSESFAPALYNLGRICAQRQQWAESFSLLSRAVKLMPASPDIAVQCAVSAVRVGAHAEALRLLVQCVEASPFHLDATVTLADVLVELSHFDVADELLANAEQRFTRKAIIPARRAAIALRRGNATAAKACVLRQVALNPDDIEGWLLKASLELGALDIDAAEDSAFEALRRAPRSARGHLLLGMVYESAQLKDAAERAYRNAVKLDPHDWRSRNNLATLLLERPAVTATKEARGLLEDALLTAPADELGRVQFNLALAALKLSDKVSSQRHAATAAASVAQGHPLRAEVDRFMQNFA